MEKWLENRERVLRKDVSKRQILRETGMHWKTLEKILEHPFPPSYQRSKPPVKSKVGPYLKQFKDILETDKMMPKKCLGTQFKWKNFLLFCERFLANRQTNIHPIRKSFNAYLHCIARFGGRVTMGLTKARRNLAAAGRAEQPGRVLITLSKLIFLMLPALSSSHPAWL